MSKRPRTILSSDDDDSFRSPLELLQQSKKMRTAEPQIDETDMDHQFVSGMLNFSPIQYLLLLNYLDMQTAIARSRNEELSDIEVIDDMPQPGPSVPYSHEGGAVASSSRLSPVHPTQDQHRLRYSTSTPTQQSQVPVQPTTAVLIDYFARHDPPQDDAYFNDLYYGDIEEDVDINKLYRK